MRTQKRHTQKPFEGGGLKILIWKIEWIFQKGWISPLNFPPGDTPASQTAIVWFLYKIAEKHQKTSNFWKNSINPRFKIIYTSANESRNKHKQDNFTIIQKIKLFNIFSFKIYQFMDSYSALHISIIIFFLIIQSLKCNQLFQHKMIPFQKRKWTSHVRHKKELD